MTDEPMPKGLSTFAPGDADPESPPEATPLEQRVATLENLVSEMQQQMQRDVQYVAQALDAMRHSIGPGMNTLAGTDARSVADGLGTPVSEATPDKGFQR